MILKNEFLEVEISEYGASIVSIMVPDKDGKKVDVVLGYDSLDKYKRQTKYIGATVGRCCGRIKDGKIKIKDKIYKLSQNEGKNHLHGGNIGFDKKFWQARKIDDSVEMFYKSADGEENYPGNLNVKVTYSLDGESVVINYSAITDKETICNLTNHSYFNLNGYGDVLNQKVQIFSNNFIENDSDLLPTGEIKSVTNTVMDFRRPKTIGKDINSDFYQVKLANGFDNNWIIKNYNGEIHRAARAFSDETGIELEVYTDLPGVQFYSGNFLDGAENGKNDMPIKNYSGFCLECQYLPYAVDYKNFTKPILKPGKLYNKTIIYKFKTK